MPGLGSFGDSWRVFRQRRLEADKIYDSIEAQLEKRRKKNNGSTSASLKSAEQTGAVSSQFEAYKRDLTSVSLEEWAEIPEAKEYLKVKKRTFDRFTPPPSSLTDFGEAKA